MLDELLGRVSALGVRQLKEWGEILTGWETVNRYGIVDDAGRLVLAALEMGKGLGGFLLRTFLKTMRPFTIVVAAADGKEQLRIVRPWRWWLSYAAVHDVDGGLVGTIQQRFAFLTRVFDVYRGDGRPLGRLVGPFFHPWTFTLKRGESEVGVIRKKFSGLLKEVLTDADNFGVEFGKGAADDLATRKMLLGATFLIDVKYFERTSR